MPRQFFAARTAATKRRATHYAPLSDAQWTALVTIHQSNGDIDRLRDDGITMRTIHALERYNLARVEHGYVKLTDLGRAFTENRTGFAGGIFLPSRGFAHHVSDGVDAPHAHVALYRLDTPLRGYTYVVASASKRGVWEVAIFPSNAQGNVLAYTPLVEPLRQEKDHGAAFRKIGYRLIRHGAGKMAPYPPALGHAAGRARRSKARSTSR